MKESGVDTSKPIVSSCGGGITAAYNFACFKHAGLTEVSMYDGSWAEYVIFIILQVNIVSEKSSREMKA